MPSGIARICNDARAAKARFYVLHSVEHCTRCCSRSLMLQPTPDSRGTNRTDSRSVRSNVDAVLYQARDVLANEVLASVQGQLDRLNAGILVANVNVQQVAVPEQVQASFNDAVKATADRDRFKNEGEAYASDVIPQAQGSAARLREEAEGYRARVVSMAEGDAERFRAIQEEYKKALIYVDLQDLTYQEAADALSVPIGTVRSRVSRGRAELRRRLQDVLPDKESKEL